MNCPVCSTRVMPGAAFCDNCGSPLQNSAPAQPSGSSCHNCGEGVLPGEAFCGNCGSALSAAPPVPPTQIGGAPQTMPPPSIPTQQAASVPPQPDGNECAACGTILQPGSLFCDNCGASVSSPQTPQQQYTPPQQPTYTPPPAEPAYTPPVQPPFTPRLVVRASNTSLSIPSGRDAVLIGREDPISNHFPDVDLTPHGGDEGGVGRRHATLHLQDGQAALEDHQSVNGTYVNRQRLQSGVPQPLNDGDELRFGRVVLMYYSS